MSSLAHIIDLNAYGPQGERQREQPADLGAAIAKFQEKIQKEGYGCPDVEMDGELHRFATPDDKSGAKSGWYVLYAEGKFPAGAYGNWKEDSSIRWCSKEEYEMSPAETREHNEYVERAKAEQKRRKAEAQVSAANRYWNIYQKLPNAPADHPYLKKKGVTAMEGIRISRSGRLAIPLLDAASTFWGIQWIDGAGKKMFGKDVKITGNYFLIDGDRSTMFVCEGYATGASIAMASGKAVVVAFNAGNLDAAIVSAKEAFKDARFVLAADDDRWPKPDAKKPHVNVGQVKADEASKKHGIPVVTPTFTDLSKQPTDWNDLHKLETIEAVRAQLAQVGQEEEVNLDELSDDLSPSEYTLDGFLGVGPTYIGGGHGVGKSNLLAVLAAIITGEIASPHGVEAFLKRVVIYLAEDPQQVSRIRYGLIKHCGLRKNGRFILRQTRRLPSTEIGRLVSRLVKEHTIEGPNGYPVKPLIVFDTLSASFELENENDNAEAARFISAMKEADRVVPIWLIGHLAKALLRAEVEAMSGRGAGAWEADAQGTAFIFAEPDGAQDVRYLATKKRRFEADYFEARFETSLDEETRTAPWGQVQDIRIRYGIPERSDAQTRKADVQAVVDERKAGQDMRARMFVLEFLRQCSDPVSKNDIEQYVTEQNSPRESARRALSDLVGAGEVETVEKYYSRDGKKRTGGYQLSFNLAGEV